MSGPALLVDPNPTVQRVIAAMLRQQGFDPALAHDDTEAIRLLRDPQRPFALAVVDASAHQSPTLRQLLLQDPRRRHLPVLLISASLRLLRELGPQALPKPFDAAALREAIAQAQRRALAPASGAVPPSSTRIPISNPTLTSRSPLPRAQDEVSIDSQAPALPEPARLASLARLMLEHLGVRGWYEQEELEEAAKKALEGASAGQDGGPTSQGAPREVLRGVADAVPLGEVMQVLQMQMQTGVLEIRRHQGPEVKVYFQNGLVDLVISRGAGGEFRVGRYLLAEGLIQQDALAEAVEQSQQEGRLLGDVLVERGDIDREQLTLALMKQSSELIYEVLRWKEARYVFFREKSLPRNLDAQLGLPVASLVMEGFRRVDEWRLIEESLSPGLVLLRDEAALDRLGPGRLSKQERAMLEQIDGQRTVEQLLAAVNASSFEGSKILYQFLQSRLVRRRSA
jgi:CheY-like chemotaxis protein